MKTLDKLGISPAPWVLDEQPYGSWITDQRGWYLSSDDGEFPNRADARLIASAPMLYEALAAMLHCAELNKPYLDMSHMDIAMDMARKAIAAASGESEVRVWCKHDPTRHCVDCEGCPDESENGEAI